jgi:hypothetical protein
MESTYSLETLVTTARLYAYGTITLKTTVHITNTTVAEPEGSRLLKPKSVIGDESGAERSC